MSQIRDDYKKTYIAGAATTQVFSGAGRLHSIVVGTSVAATISIIDNTTGTTVNLGLIGASPGAGTFVFNCSVTTGLRIITAGASTITVIYSTNA
jgi:hypothetical protein